MFFSRFENIDYDDRSMKDLSIAIIIKPEIKNNKDLFFLYEMEEWERPETVAFDHYGNTKYNFIILLMNDIVDPFFDWPLERHELMAKVELEYGTPSITNGKYDTVTDLDSAGNPVSPFRNAGYNAIRYWFKEEVQYQYAPGTGHDQFLLGLKSTDGPLFGEAPVGSIAVTNLEYEEALDAAKRTIKILHPELIPQMDKELDYIFNG